jgi:16S rRNA C1402 (ribose-2'-O) methylase RsmI
MARENLLIRGLAQKAGIFYGYYPKNKEQRRREYKL